MQIRLSLTHQNRPADVWLLLSIYALKITEFWGAVPELWTKCPSRYISVLNSDKRNRLQDAKTHLSALVKVVENAGGWKAVDPYVLESSILADKYLALNEMTTPVIPLTWDLGRMPKARQDEFQLSHKESLPRLGQKHLQIPMCRALTEAIEEVVDFLQTAHRAWCCVDLLTSLDENWLFLRNQALVYRLLSLPESLEKVEHCIRITTLLFLLNSTEYHGAYISARNALQYLASALIQARLWDQTFDDGLLFWCLCTGGMTIESSHEKEWFQGMLIKLFKSPSSVWTKDVFREDLEPYLFLSAKQEAQLSGLVDSLAAKMRSVPN